MKLYKNKSRAGFTIVEMVIVVAVIGIIAGITVIGWGAWQNNTAKAAVQSDLKQAVVGMENSKNFNNTYPTSLPSSFTKSSGVTITYVPGDSTKYCIQASSTKITSVKFYVSSFNTTPTQGTCVDALACNGGDKLSGATCSNQYLATYNNGVPGTYQCPNGGTPIGSTCSYAATPTYTCPAPTGSYRLGSDGKCYYWTYGSGAWDPGVTCGAGYYVDGPYEQAYYCVSTTPTNPASTTYACNSGATLSGSTCSYAGTYNSGSSSYYSCPSGGTLNGTTCTKTYQAYSWV